jgi:hypothetical protein
MDVAVWRTAFASAAAEFLARLVGYLPTLTAGLGLVVLGYIVARGSRSVVERLLAAGLAVLTRHTGVGRAVERTALGPGFVTLLSRVIYWIILTLFIAAAVERMELAIAATLVSALAAFLPRVLVALVIVFGAVIAGHLVRQAVDRAAMATGLAQAGLLARAAQAALVFLGVVTAADELGIQSTLLTVVVATVVGSVLGGATLAFGLGSRVAVSNIIAMYYLLKTYRVGQVIRIGEVEGEIVEVTPTGVFIASPDGRVLVPGRRFSEEISTLMPGART